MSKTPEEMAQQHVSTIADTHSVKTACEKAFIAGYQRKAIEELSSVQKEELKKELKEKITCLERPTIDDFRASLYGTGVEW
jgi:hypothetical protein